MMPQKCPMDTVSRSKNIANMLVSAICIFKACFDLVKLCPQYSVKFSPSIFSLPKLYSIILGVVIVGTAVAVLLLLLKTHHSTNPLKANTATHAPLPP